MYQKNQFAEENYAHAGLGLHGKPSRRSFLRYLLGAGALAIRPPFDFWLPAPGDGIMTPEPAIATGQPPEIPGYSFNNFYVNGEAVDISVETLERMKERIYKRGRSVAQSESIGIGAENADALAQNLYDAISLSASLARHYMETGQNVFEPYGLVSGAVWNSNNSLASFVLSMYQRLQVGERTFSEEELEFYKILAKDTLDGGRDDGPATIQLEKLGEEALYGVAGTYFLGLLFSGDGFWTDFISYKLYEALLPYSEKFDFSEKISQLERNVLGYLEDDGLDIPYNKIVPDRTLYRGEFINFYLENREGILNLLEVVHEYANINRIQIPEFTKKESVFLHLIDKLVVHCNPILRSDLEYNHNLGLDKERGELFYYASADIADTLLHSIRDLITYVNNGGHSVDLSSKESIGDELRNLLYLIGMRSDTLQTIQDPTTGNGKAFFDSHREAWENRHITSALYSPVPNEDAIPALKAPIEIIRGLSPVYSLTDVIAFRQNTRTSSYWGEDGDPLTKEIVYKVYHSLSGVFLHEFGHAIDRYRHMERVSEGRLSWKQALITENIRLMYQKLSSDTVWDIAHLLENEPDKRTDFLINSFEIIYLSEIGSIKQSTWATLFTAFQIKPEYFFQEVTNQYRPTPRTAFEIIEVLRDKIKDGSILEERPEVQRAANDLMSSWNAHYLHSTLSYPIEAYPGHTLGLSKPSSQVDFDSFYNILGRDASAVRKIKHKTDWNSHASRVMHDQRVEIGAKVLSTMITNNWKDEDIGFVIRDTAEVTAEGISRLVFRRDQNSYGFSRHDAVNLAMHLELLGTENQDAAAAVASKMGIEEVMFHVVYPFTDSLFEDEGMLTNYYASLFEVHQKKFGEQPNAEDIRQTMYRAFDFIDGYIDTNGTPQSWNAWMEASSFDEQKLREILSWHKDFLDKNFGRISHLSKISQMTKR